MTPAPRAYAIPVTLVAALVFLFLRTATYVAVRGGWFAQARWPAIVGCASLFLAWPFLVLYFRRGSGAATGTAWRVLAAVPAAAALAPVLASMEGRWFPSAAVCREAGGIAVTGALVMALYGAVVVASAWRASPDSRVRSHEGQVWRRTLALLTALMSLTVLAAVAAGALAPQLCAPAMLAENVLAACAIGLAVVAAATRSGAFRFAAPPGAHDPNRLPRAGHTRMVKESLLLLMRTAQPYRNPDLRISDLADALQVPVHVLSGVINREFGSSFFDFVNGYRVQEAARLLLDPERRGFTILSIATDVGFASKTAFNRAFKKHLGVTPSEYQRQELTRGHRTRSQ